ncbi:MULTISPECIES: hypothetical protein [Nostoc]|uniref:Uncharacterized protein n=1 Tax=Nostoc paludosum FACHB-159 TaxID=2692908 RepID=A0ABR8KGE4_9NOSO|nr:MULTISPECIES: hypothetical protein [Nostoc]MBD2682286.1 hypothetical protein [Nostoc sp. FACHB-857]MBD2738620.1 hypothetical protein [Nostoc paludosum FACHB-159]
MLQVLGGKITSYLLTEDLSRVTKVMFLTWLHQGVDLQSAKERSRRERNC